MLSAPDERAVEPMKGAVYVFRRSGATWTQEGPPITREDGAGWDYFGRELALSKGVVVMSVPGMNASSTVDEVGGLTLRRIDASSR